ncbi:hypothetical protein SUGI_0692890 [Cryptomeria japonica]|nr:hypothetical protein SUGI_0692890 [Cryptomeria japonica]
MVIKDLLTFSSLELTNAIDGDDNGGAHNINNDHRPSCVQRPCCINIHSSSPTRAPVQKSTPSAELLCQAGIDFAPGKLEFKKRRPEKGTLFLPQISVGDSTEILLRNLMAYEDCQRALWSPEETIISQYVILFDYLISSEKDVSILQKSQIINSLLGSDEDTARMFNHLGNHMTFHPIKQIENVTIKVREHCSSQWKTWVAQFKEEYFSMPWYVVSLVAATALLVMSFIQTVYAVKK